MLSRAGSARASVSLGALSVVVRVGDIATRPGHFSWPGAQCPRPGTRPTVRAHRARKARGRTGESPFGSKILVLTRIRTQLPHSGRELGETSRLSSHWALPCLPRMEAHDVCPNRITVSTIVTPPPRGSIRAAAVVLGGGREGLASGKIAMPNQGAGRNPSNAGLDAPWYVVGPSSVTD